MEITVILTCFNRKDNTLNCISRLLEGNKNVDLSFIIVDDNSTDGTYDEVKNLLKSNSKILHGNGELYWAGGMRKGINYYFQSNANSDYILFVNDDVMFFDNIIDDLISLSIKNSDAIIAGATCDKNGNLTYGAVKCDNPHKREIYHSIKPNNKGIRCDTFNCNCVLIKHAIFKALGNFDKMYIHSLADYDYGFFATKNNYSILSSEKYIGICELNSNEKTWKNTSLSRIERIQKKESIKGAPFKPWFYYLNKNFGFWIACKYSISPYLRIILKK